MRTLRPHCYQHNKLSNNQIIEIMYEAIEHWNEYQKKIKAQQEMDKFLNKLVAKNGTTNY